MSAILPVLPMQQIIALCERYHVRELSLFGSALRDDFGPESDYDFLVSFQPDAQVSLFEVGGLQYDLQCLMGRKVDLVQKDGLRNPYRKQSILETAQVIYVAEG